MKLLMHRLCSYIYRYKLIFAGLLLYLAFFFSVASTGWFDVFFSGPALHVGAKGIDFLQVPRGAWSFWHGGSLDGEPLKSGGVYADKEAVNSNVYHPLFTLTLGTFLATFSPGTAWLLWLWLKFVLSLAVVALFYQNFHASKYVQLAIFLLTANLSIYLELAAGQFQFLVNIAVLLLLIALTKRSSVWLGGLLYGLGLLVKPLGLLFVPILLLKRQWTTVVVGLGLFILSTLVMLTAGGYYIDGLIANIFYPWNPGPNQIITLFALWHSLVHEPAFVSALLRYSVLGLLLLLGVWRRIDLNKAIFLLVVYFLCFYNQVYEYDWSLLAYVGAICVVCCPSFQTRFARFCLLLICLPSCFVLLRILHFDVVIDKNLGAVPGTLAWQLMVISKVVPLLLLTGSVLAPDLAVLLQRCRSLWSSWLATGLAWRLR